MLQRDLANETDALEQIAAALTEANLDYLCHCVDFWLAVKPNCGVKAWLEYSIRRSTHRLAIDGLQEMIARVSDQELIQLYEHRGGGRKQKESQPTVPLSAPKTDLFLLYEHRGVNQTE